eukprot:TRINITY_DN3704_c0_g1_i1.p1 TRINITY_DN3704_c0_g1~~TRINITY_DN3704_c0_g1_i1.p1  ORF type:complete len:152 (+),score=20.06 TRINITY_DN3704_c0_g1_i1:1011-1466(+)
MFDTRGNAKLISFSKSLFIVEKETTIEFVGSPFYMAPEIVNNRPHGLPVDVWSIGILITELANKKIPHSSSPVKAMFCSVTQGHHKPLMNESKWTKELNDFLSQVLKRDPTKRIKPSKLLQHEWINGEDIPSKQDMIELFGRIRQKVRDNN